MPGPITSAFLSLILLSVSLPALAQPGPPPLQALGEAPAPQENPITEPKRVLGKILFWDEQLSSDNTVACGTCHRPAAGGADPRRATHPGNDEIFGTADDIIGSFGIRALDSTGRQLNDPIFGHSPQVTGRAAPSFFTSMFADSNFWDGRATDEFVDPLNESNIVISTGGSLESQAVGPILSSVEMAQADRTWQDVINKLEQVVPLALASDIPADMADALQGGKDYGDLFLAAFSSAEINPTRIAMAIATYERTLVPNETPWDEFIEGDNSAMTAQQIEGWQLFNDSVCRNCHVPPLFSDNNFHNIGLRPANEDLGQFELTGQNNDRGKFKTPSLRNIGSKSALMHLGWISDVSDAFDFYNAGAADTGHTQFTQRQSNIPNSNIELNEVDVFANDDQQRNKIIDFIVNGLSDPRASQEVFPFDRPTLASESAQEPSVQYSNAIRTDLQTSSAQFELSVLGDSNRADTHFSLNEAITINARITIDPNDIGLESQLYCVVSYGGNLFALNEDGGFTLWNGDTASLTSARSIQRLGSIENIGLVSGLSQLSGVFEIYVGYMPNDNILRFNARPFSFEVE
ncbi:MAG: cytochrome c peroxidase [Pseudohongiellaceae bacterium]|nr:cytochrome c peroxidase [Pseudohongiellaceae bacterium]